MEATLTLHQAGARLGVDDTALSRLIRIGALPEAKKINGPNGAAWVIPADRLPAIATRNGWTIDLRDGEATLIEPTEATDHESTDHESIGAEPADGIAAGEEADAVPIDVGEADAEPAETGSLNGQAVVDLGALIPHRPSSPTAAASDAIETTEAQAPADDPQPSEGRVEGMDLALLDRLLEAQEERVTAQVDIRETRFALAALNESHDRTTAELEIERRERLITSDRYREERMARAVADAKIAELRDRVAREMELADEEKNARAEAVAGRLAAERDTANAVAAMGWRARRRYRRLSKRSEE